MRPLATLAGGVLIGACAMGIAQGQTLTEATMTAMFNAPLAPAPLVGEISREDRQAAYVSGAVLVQQNTTQVSRLTQGGAVDTVRVTSAQSALTPQGFVSLAPGGPYVGPNAYGVDYTRTWPAALRGATGAYAIDVSPQAGVGYGAAGASVGGGATVRLSTQSRDAKIVDRLKAMGVEDGARYGEQGRWYLFAAASGRAVGLNMVANGQGGLARDGWSTDPAALVGDAQLGIGWRRGDAQTSLGYLMRKVRVRDDYASRLVDLPSNEQIAGITFSYKPRR